MAHAADISALAMWLFGMNAYEKAMIRSPLQKVCKKLFK